MDWKEDEHPRDDKGQFVEKGNNNFEFIAMSKSNKLYSKEKVLMLPKQEYAELCSAIRTEFGDKIPKSGRILYKNSYYVYNYSRKSELIVCTYKIEIEGNESLIDKLEENGYGK